MDHPGLLLKNFLREEKMSYNAFAKAIKVPTNRVAEICGGRRSITADTALRLSRFFEPRAEYSESRAEYWMEQQAQYDLFLAEERMKKEK